MIQPKCPWKYIGKAFLIPVLIFVLLLAGALFFDFALERYVHGAVYANFVIQGGVWATMCIIFWAISARGEGRLKRLKEEGELFDGVIEDFHQVNGVRIMHYLTLRADCSYMNHEQKKCLVRSRAFLYGNTPSANFTKGLSGSDFTVQVYVNRENPHDYAVELFEQGGEPISADYDYR